MHDERQFEAHQRVARALHPARGEAQRLAGARQAVERSALRGHVGQLAQLAQRHRDAVVPADHRQAGRAAIHFLGLLDQAEAADQLFAQFGPGMQVQQHGTLAPLGQLLLPVQFAVERADAFFQHLAQARVAFQDQLHGLLGDDQQAHVGLGDGRCQLLLPHHAGAFAEDIALPKRRQGELAALFAAHHAHGALAHHVQAPVLAPVLLQDLFPCADALDAHAAHGIGQFLLVELAAQVEQPRDKAAGGTDRDIAGDKGQRGRVAGDHRLGHAARDHQQLGLARGTHRRLVPVLAQQRDIGKDLAGLAHAHADFLAVFFVEHAHGPRLDDKQPGRRVAGVADGIAKTKSQHLRGIGQARQFLRRQHRQDFHAGEESGQRGSALGLFRRCRGSRGRGGGGGFARLASGLR
ncbi:hypothetical protein FQZ97_736810 [compost metagenome]